VRIRRFLRAPRIDLVARPEARKVRLALRRPRRGRRHVDLAVRCSRQSCGGMSDPLSGCARDESAHQQDDTCADNCIPALITTQPMYLCDWDYGTEPGLAHSPWCARRHARRSPAASVLKPRRQCVQVHPAWRHHHHQLAPAPVPALGWVWLYHKHAVFPGRSAFDPSSTGTRFCG